MLVLILLLGTAGADAVSADFAVVLTLLLLLPLLLVLTLLLGTAVAVAVSADFTAGRCCCRCR